MGDPLEEDMESVDDIAQALERGFSPGLWWMASNTDGLVLAETSNPVEFVELGLMDRDDVKIYRQYLRSDVEWVRETPKP